MAELGPKVKKAANLSCCGGTPGELRVRDDSNKLVLRRARSKRTAEMGGLQGWGREGGGGIRLSKFNLQGSHRLYSHYFLLSSVEYAMRAESCRDSCSPAALLQRRFDKIRANTENAKAEKE